MSTIDQCEEGLEGGNTLGGGATGSGAGGSNGAGGKSGGRDPARRHSTPLDGSSSAQNNGGGKGNNIRLSALAFAIVSAYVMDAPWLYEFFEREEWYVFVQDIPPAAPNSKQPTTRLRTREKLGESFPAMLARTLRALSVEEATTPCRSTPSSAQNNGGGGGNGKNSTPPECIRPPYNPNPATRTPSPLPPPNTEWSPWAGAANPAANAARAPSPMPPRLPSPVRDGSLTAPLPTPAALTTALPSIAAAPPDAQLAWARDGLFLVDRTPALAAYPLALAAVPLALAAVPLILALAFAQVPEAVYYRATFAAAGTYPALLPPPPPTRAPPSATSRPPRARAGPPRGSVSRDYEAFSDAAHALDCLNRGAKARDAAALHRLGTAYLLKQLGMLEDAARALGRRVVRACCVRSPYVFGLILLGEFGASGPTSTPLPIPPALLLPLIPAGQTRELYARAMLEQAAALHFAPAQYKLGHAFEFVVPASAFPFDPLLSVQWYSLASQAGEAEADMALSKWFLCGAEGAFDKDESLARTFAAKAAAKGLARGEFAMGYYCEVGIGGRKEEEARGWCAKMGLRFFFSFFFVVFGIVVGGRGGKEGRWEAAAHGNTDAAERLRAMVLAGDGVGGAAGAEPHGARHADGGQAPATGPRAAAHARHGARAEELARGQEPYRQASAGGFAAGKRACEALRGGRRRADALRGEDARALMPVVWVFGYLVPYAVPWRLADGSPPYLQASRGPRRARTAKNNQDEGGRI
ncbi:hypothetical protein C8F04DRAFT_1402113 [Mycena alexandri]|uniref:Uncharacterized protein n=1 Tax=Mycena alexandri TaxID=1745969 RepID=A0AAD6S8N7_9AGAR|nr:hypothetical protein C8F04DRAFT_1402113 [Mycena alexandri]